MRLISLILLFICISLILASIPMKVKAQYEGITYDSSANVVTFNQESSAFIDDLYAADNSNPLTLIQPNGRLLSLNYDASGLPWTNQTAGANEATADDVYLVPNSPVALGDEVYFGNPDIKFNKVTLNITTAGVYTSTITWQYRSTTVWATLSVTQSPNPVFKSLGVGTVSFTAPSTWTKTAVNGVTAYWIKARITTAGTVTTQPLAGQVWLSYPILTSLIRTGNLQPADSLSLYLTAIINQTTFTSSGTIEITGTNAEDNWISETLIIDNSTESYITSYRYKTVTNGFKVTGEFTFYLTQPRWGILGQYANAVGGYSWTLLCAIQFGDGSSIVSIADTLKQIYIPSSISTSQTSIFLVKNNATLTFGTLIDEDIKATKNGLQIFSEKPYLIRGDAGSQTNLYASDIIYYTLGISSSVKMSFYGNARFWGYKTNYDLEGNLDVYNLFSFGAFCAIQSFLGGAATSGTFDKISVVGATYGIAAQFIPDPITITNLYIRNASLYSVFHVDADDPMYLINPDIDNWAKLSVGIAPIYRQYTFALTVIHENGTAVEGATVTISHSGVNAGVDFSGTTNSSGQIPTQILTYGFYNFTGGTVIYDYNPFLLDVEKVGYDVQNHVFNVTKKIDWEMTFPETAETTRFSASNYDGFIESLIGWDELNGTVYDSDVVLMAGHWQDYFYTNHYERSFVFFNTTAIQNDVIKSATLWIYVLDLSRSDVTTIIQKGINSTVPHLPLESNDFDKNLYTGDGGRFLGSAGWHSVALDTSYINKFGWTKLVLRTDGDLGEKAYLGDALVYFGSAEGTNASYLEIKSTPIIESKLGEGLFSGLLSSIPISILLVVVLLRRKVKKKEQEYY